MGKIDCKPLRSRGENKKNGIFGIYKLLQNLRFKNMTIPQAFIFLTLIMLIAAIAILSIEFTIFENLEKEAMSRYFEAVEVSGNVLYVYLGDTNGKSAGRGATLDFIENWKMIAFLITAMSLIICEAYLFYRLKLKKPLNILNIASEKIAANDLDFRIYYDSGDEMGRLCDSFEKMRAALEENNRRMWRSVEERRRINAAFAHDLRTPLTVLRGYTDLLEKYLPQDKFPKEKLIATVSMMNKHISRIENYVNSMNTLQKLEDISVYPKPVEPCTFLQQLKECADMLTYGKGIKVCFEKDLSTEDFSGDKPFTEKTSDKKICPGSEICLDSEIVLQVFENLVSNAVRFAGEKIEIRCNFDIKNSSFNITVSDDGPGFTEEELKKATEPFYKGKKDADDLHFGLGLHICKTLCEKHGGMLLVRNNGSGGAMVTAIFAC